MGEIILLILKILLFAVLGILAFVFLILLLVMLVPVRYRIDGSMHEEKPDGFAEVSWLLKAVRARLLIRDKKPALDLRILYFLHLGKKKEESAEEAGSPGQESQGSMEEPEEGQEEKPPDVSEVPEEQEPPPPDSGETESPGTDGETSGETDEAEGITGKIRKLFEKIRDTVTEKTAQVKELLRDLEDKKNFLMRDRVKAAIAHVLRMVMKMLKHLMPKSAKGDVIFGLDSPADTGNIAAVLSMTMPVHKNNIRVTPDFDRKIIEGEACIKGRIFIGYLVITAVRIFLNRNVLYTLKHFKKHFSKKSKEE